MTLTFEFNVDNVKVKLNQYAKFLDQRPLSSDVIIRTHTHTRPIAIDLYLDH